MLPVISAVAEPGNKEIAAHDAVELEMAVVLDIYIAVQCALQGDIGARK